MTIDLSKSYPSPGLHARMVWQVLFNIYRARGGDLDKMDSMLCNLYTIERLFKENSVDFFWDSESEGYTTICCYPQSDDAIRVRLERMTAHFTEQPSEVWG